jgi:hypothetical protein
VGVLVTIMGLTLLGYWAREIVTSGSKKRPLTSRLQDVSVDVALRWFLPAVVLIWGFRAVVALELTWALLLFTGLALWCWHAARSWKGASLQKLIWSACRTVISRDTRATATADGRRRDRDDEDD